MMFNLTRFLHPLIKRAILRLLDRKEVEDQRQAVSLLRETGKYGTGGEVTLVFEKSCLPFLLGNLNTPLEQTGGVL